jgi:hypothetical protein
VKRETFLLWMLAGLLTWQAAIFSYGTVMCTRAMEPKEVCPELGDRFDGFVNTSLGAVLGLLAGSVATRQRP